MLTSSTCRPRSDRIPRKGRAVLPFDGIEPGVGEADRQGFQQGRRGVRVGREDVVPDQHGRVRGLRRAQANQVRRRVPGIAVHAHVQRRGRLPDVDQQAEPGGPFPAGRPVARRARSTLEVARQGVERVDVPQGERADFPGGREHQRCRARQCGMPEQADRGRAAEPIRQDRCGSGCGRGQERSEKVRLRRRDQFGRGLQEEERFPQLEVRGFQQGVGAAPVAVQDRREDEEEPAQADREHDGAACVAFLEQ